MAGASAAPVNAGRLAADLTIALINGRVILPGSVAEGLTVLVENGRIRDVLAGPGTGSAEVFDLDGRYLSPGLVDIHIHGALHRWFNEPDDDAFATITSENLRHGVTSLLATLATAPIDDLVACLETSRRWMDQPRAGAQVLGVHVEGPYFSREFSGAQDPASLRTPDDGSVDALLAHHDVIRMMSYAPELPGSMALTERLGELGVVAAAGHSACRDSQFLDARAAGLSHVIHLWSAQSTTVKEGPYRMPGLLEASLAHDGHTAEIIADGRHLPPTLMRLAYRCFGPDRLCIVSDATAGAGLPDGTTFGLGTMRYVVQDGVGMRLDGVSFAGSSTLLNQMVALVTSDLGWSVAEAVRMASLTPARVIGVADRKGSIEVGKDADLVVFEDDFQAARVMVGGEWVGAATAGPRMPLTEAAIASQLP